jgi:hypothetical protein
MRHARERIRRRLVRYGFRRGPSRIRIVRAAGCQREAGDRNNND